VHPGILLRDCVIIPSEVQIKSWASLFRVSEKQLSLILNGDLEMPPGLAVKLNRLFPSTDAFWVRRFLDYHQLNVRLRPSKYKEYESEESYFGLLISPAIKVLHDRLERFDIKLKDMSLILGLPAGELASQKRKKRSRVSFQLADRLGAAFGFDPRYWLALDIDFWLFRCFMREVKRRKAKTF
jgi:plasmid maintenance system antidote protein VapI